MAHNDCSEVCVIPNCFEGNSRKIPEMWNFKVQILTSTFHYKMSSVTIWTLSAKIHNMHLYKKEFKAYCGFQNLWEIKLCRTFFPVLSQRSWSPRRSEIRGAISLSSWDGSTQFPMETCHYIYHTSTFGPKSASQRVWIFTVRTPGNQSINSHGYFPTGLMENIFVFENVPGLSQDLQHLYTTWHSLTNRMHKHAPFGPWHHTNICSYWLHLWDAGIHPNLPACDSA